MDIVRGKKSVCIGRCPLFANDNDDDDFNDGLSGYQLYGVAVTIIIIIICCTFLVATTPTAAGTGGLMSMPAYHCSAICVDNVSRE